ncbi:putative hemoglobin and hemoglobin-haptoglobin-binding protein 3 precursor [Nocardioides dokdonensis FR1436]|uniref:Putative hemoglobin and hemoglobin-haptoglobin-binding protein 3 n=1 Tax=Nocardioides dokdonensis FR1436 TaxID=1300347 RepID=A0A1A9GIB3_9ACTN|nr:PT domain-containing protein [Nocardioides dokdonensis]ANH38059.1 putative hemoglobin and hemoglobin-haptoglobin-binding protein 3 precursor [Nocardioides dokdonensis FR1436]
MKGPQRQRLDAALAAADEDVVAGQGGGAQEWGAAAERLRTVRDALHRAAGTGAGIGGQTGKSLFAALEKAATHLERYIDDLEQGARALTDSSAAISRTRTARDAIDTTPGLEDSDAPGSFSPDPEWDQVTLDRKRTEHQTSVSQHEEREARREAKAKEVADAMEAGYEEPIAVMKRIHGVPDPEPGSRPGRPGSPYAPTGSTPGGGSGASGGGGPRSGAGTLQPTWTAGPTDQPLPQPVDQPLDQPTDQPTDQPVDQPPTTPTTTSLPPTGDLPPEPSGTGSTPLQPTSIDPATTSAPGGGAGIGTGAAALGGGLLLGGAARGIAARAAGVVPGQGTVARPLGTTARSAVSGTLGRSTAGSPTPRAGGVGGTAAGRGTGAGSSRAGARGAAGTGTGRGGSKKSRDRADQDFYADDDWDETDDDIAPGVLG